MQESDFSTPKQSIPIVYKIKLTSQLLKVEGINLSGIILSSFSICTVRLRIAIEF